jgi:hypothetical protein
MTMSYAFIKVKVSAQIFMYKDNTNVVCGTLSELIKTSLENNEPIIEIISV